jgi:ribonuclease H2 subunit C
VLKVTDRKAVDTQNAAGKVGEEDEEEDEDGDMVDVSIAEKVGEFDEVIVWGHGGAVDEREDVYARGIREWTRFAEAMHAEEEGDEEEGDAEEKKTG